VYDKKTDEFWVTSLQPWKRHF